MSAVASELGRWGEGGGMKENEPSTVDEVDVGLKLRSHAQRSRSILMLVTPIIKIKVL